MSNLQFNLGKADSPGKAMGIVGAIFYALFGLPFLGVGIFIVKEAVLKLNAGQTKEALTTGLFGLVFAGAGLGVMLLGFWSLKKSKQAAALQASHPNEPWRRRPDWAVGRVKASTDAQWKIMLFMGTVFSGFGGLIATQALAKELHQGNYLVLVALIFPLIGIGLLAAAIRGVLAQHRYGKCFFEMASIPGAIGGSLEGMIQTGARLKPEHGLHLKLSCIRRVVSGSGKNRSTQENILWQDEKVFKAQTDLPEPEPGRSGIPVFFKIPAHQPECSAHGNESILCRLETKAKMAGPDFSATFEVPVFLVAGAAVATADEPDPTAAMQMPVEEIRRDEHSKIRVTNGPNGREFYFPAARNLGAAVMLTVFLVIWSFFLWMMIRLHAPLLFPIIFGLLEMLILWGCFSLWFKASRVTINSSGVTAVNRWLVFTKSRQFDPGDIVRFARSEEHTSELQS